MNYLFDNRTGVIACPKTLFEYKKENNLLIFNFVAMDSSLESYSDIDNDDLWRLNVVEVFLDLGDDFYYEFEVAPNGAVFIAIIKDRRIMFVDDDFFKSKVEIKDDTYKVTMEIDLSKLSVKGPIKFNAFRVEEVDGFQILEAINPTYSNTFHVKEKFIELK